MWIAYKTIVVKEILRFSRIWIQTIIPPVITTSLYLLIFGGLMGSRIGQMQGIDYLTFHCSRNYPYDCHYAVLR